MNAREVRELVESQIGNDWATMNHHGIGLRAALVTPEKIAVIERTVRNGKIRDRPVAVWLVLVEKTDAGSGFRIVFKEDDPMFGLASDGFPNDEHLVLCGWYGDFMSTFQAM